MTTADVQILRMTPANAAKLQRVDDDVFDYEIHAEHLAAFLADPGHLMVCAFADGVAVAQARGIIHYQPDEPPQLYVDNLGVADDWRRKGVAGRLLAELEAWARGFGCVETWVLTETDNEPARALYAGRGAEENTIAYFTRTFGDPAT